MEISLSSKQYNGIRCGFRTLLNWADGNALQSADGFMRFCVSVSHYSPGHWLEVLMGISWEHIGHNIFGWWFGTLFFSINIGNVIIPTDELIFFRGVGIPPSSYVGIIFKSIWDYQSNSHICWDWIPNSSVLVRVKEFDRLILRSLDTLCYACTNQLNAIDWGCLIYNEFRFLLFILFIQFLQMIMPVIRFVLSVCGTFSFPWFL